MTVLRPRRALVSALLASLLLPVVAPLPAAGVETYLFNVRLGTTCVEGTGPASTQLTVRLLSAHGSLQGIALPNTNALGEWSTCQFWDAIDPGDIVSASDGATARGFTVPNLSAKVGRRADVVSGVGPANSSVGIEVSNCQMWDCTLAASVTRATSGTGAYARDFTAQYNIRGGDEIDVYWVSNQGDEVHARRTVPYLEVLFDGPDVFGVTHAGAQVTVQLRTAAGTLRASITDIGHSYFGGFGGRLRNASGMTVDTAPGNKVSASFSKDARLVVVNPSLLADQFSNVVAGTCYPNQPFYLYAEDPTFQRSPSWTEFAGTTNSVGDFSVNLNTQGSESGFELTGNDLVYVECRTAKGDILWNLGEAE